MRKLIIYFAFLINALFGQSVAYAVKNIDKIYQTVASANKLTSVEYEMFDLEVNLSVAKFYGDPDYDWYFVFETNDGLYQFRFDIKDQPAEALPLNREFSIKNMVIDYSWAQNQITGEYINYSSVYFKAISGASGINYYAKVIDTNANIYNLKCITESSDNQQSRELEDALFVYRNDGYYHAFLVSDIIEITQSKEDTLGFIQGEYCVQEIMTKDSLYRIPISAIDSIGFHPLPADYQPDVILLDSSNFFQLYLLEATDSTLLLSRNFPNAEIPQIGKIIISTKVPEFVGRICKISNVERGVLLECEQVEITDIYRSLQCVGRLISPDYSNCPRNARSDGDTNIDSGTSLLDLPEILHFNVWDFSFDVKPNLQLDYSYYIQDGKDFYYSNSLRGSFNCEIELASHLQGEINPEPYYTVDRLIPIPSVPGLFLNLGIGGFFEAAGGIDISWSLPFTISGATTYTKQKNQRLPSYTNNWNNDWNFNNSVFSIGLDGSFALGLAVKLGFRLLIDSGVDLITKTGPKVHAEFEIPSNSIIDNSLYEALKDEQIEFLWKNALQLYIHRPKLVSVGPGEDGFHTGFGNFLIEGKIYKLPEVSYDHHLGSVYILPEFSDLCWEESESSQGAGELDGTISRHVPMGVGIGWALYDLQDQLCFQELFPERYTSNSNWSRNGLNKYIYGLNIGASYKAYPLVSLFGLRMRANKFVDVITRPSITTKEAYNNCPQSSTLNGYCDFDAGSYPSLPNVGFAYSEDGINWEHVPSSDLSVVGTFSVTLNNLNCLTSYRYQAYVEHDGVKHYGEVKYFSTLPPDMDGTWQCEEGDGTSYTVTIQGTQCTWSGEMAEPGSLTWHSRGNLEISILMSWRPESMGGYSTINFEGSVDDKNHPNTITGEVEYHSGAMNTGYDYLLKNTSFTMTRGN